MSKIWNELVRPLLHYFIRPRSTGVLMMRNGTYIMVPLISVGWFAKVTLSYESLWLAVTFSADSFWANLFAGVAFAIAVLLIVVGGILEVAKAFQELRRRTIIVIEERGMLPSSGRPLSAFVSKSMLGKVHPITVDLSPQFANGQVTDPEGALRRLANISGNIQGSVDGRDLQDIATVFGGISPVPFMFLTGYYVGDENDVEIFDWDRDTKNWRSLDDNDDGERFEIMGIDELPPSTSECSLAVEVSYNVDLEGFSASTNRIPMVRLVLPSRTIGNHWSKAKQISMERSFRNLVIDLLNRGIEKIHLTAAAPNSVVFRLGQTYDGRMFPNLLVYQYDKGTPLRFPWSVEIPMHGAREAKYVPTIAGLPQAQAGN